MTNSVKSKRVGQIVTHPYLTLSTRIVLGGVFILAGAAKLGYIDTLIWEINQYDMLPYQLATAYGHILPPLEIALGILLVLGVFLKVSASVSGMLVLSFAVAKITALARGLEIDICGCFGPAVPLLSVYSMVIDLVLMALALQILFHRGEFLSLGSWLPSIKRRLSKNTE